MVSPPTRSPSRLVARSRRPGQRRSRSSATSAAVADHVLAVVEHDEQLAVTDHLGQPARVGQVEGGGDRGADPGGIADGGQLDEARRRTVSAADSARATSRASRVLPTPPGPTSVTKRCSASRRVQVAQLVVAADQRRQRLRDGRAAPGRGVAARSDGRPGASSDGSWARIAASSRRSSWPGSRPELLAEDTTTVLEDPQGVGLPAGAVQREHQQPAEPLAQRMGGDQLLELGDGAAGDDRAGARRRAAPRSRRGAARTTGRWPPRRSPRRRSRRAASPRHSASASASSVDGPVEVTRRRGRPSRGDELLEAVHVDGVGRELERVPAAAHGDEVGRAQRPAQLRRQPLETVAHRGRRILAPQRVDQLLGGNHPTGVQRQHGEQGALLGPGDHDVPAVVVEHLELARAARCAWGDGIPPRELVLGVMRLTGETEHARSSSAEGHGAATTQCRLSSGSAPRRTLRS